ncbi:MAG: porin family protein [Proteobacteria bacterium]|nr:porin family protein [Pseudomonadota bacterium]
MPRFIGALAIAGLAASASAADLPRMPAKAPAYAPVPAYSWAGFYLGINAGGGWGSSRWNSPVFPTGSFDVSGAMVGGTVGYNWQVNRWVLGLEGDVDWTDISGSTTSLVCPLGCRTSNSWLATVRGRIGYSFDQFLPYITGGLAVGDVRARVPGLLSVSDTQAGWTLGGGVEVALTRNWSAKAEYLYVDLGRLNCGLGCSLLGAPGTVDFTSHVARGGVNYRF